MAISAAYGSSQARGRIGAVTASLYHSSQQHWILNPLCWAGIKPETHCSQDTAHLVVPQRELLPQ